MTGILDDRYHAEYGDIQTYRTDRQAAVLSTCWFDGCSSRGGQVNAETAKAG